MSYDIADKRFRDRCYRSVVCLSRSCIVLKRQKISTQFLLHRPMSLPDSNKIWLTSVTSFLSKICPKVTHPFWFYLQSHSMANCSRMVRYSAIVTMERTIGNHRRSFEWYHRGSLRPPLPPKWGSQKHLTGPTSRRMLSPGEYDIRYRQFRLFYSAF